MPAKNKRQQKLFGMALALERGKMPKSKASKKVKDISKGMSEKEIEKFAKTKHKGLKENRALSFSNFLNEAYIDKHGKLHDLEFTHDERFELEMYDHIMSLQDFLEDAGATTIKHKLNANLLTFKFRYSYGEYYLEMDLDGGQSEVYTLDDSQKISIYSGSTDDLFEMIKYNGFDSIGLY